MIELLDIRHGFQSFKIFIAGQAPYFDRYFNATSGGGSPHLAKTADTDAFDKVVSRRLCVSFFLAGS